MARGRTAARVGRVGDGRRQLRLQRRLINDDAENLHDNVAVGSGDDNEDDDAALMHYYTSMNRQ